MAGAGFRLVQSEDDLSDFVKDYAKLNGWRRIHFRPLKNRRGKWETPLEGDAGYPDWTLVRGERLVFAELKGPRGRVESVQQEWLDDLRQVPGIEVYVWFPKDIDEIKAVLKRHRR